MGWALALICNMIASKSVHRKQPLGKLLSFFEASIALEGMGRPRVFRRFRETRLENILLRESCNRGPTPKGANFCFEKISLGKLFGYM